MAIKELFYDQRPVALLNPKAAQRIDARFTYTRTSEATYIDTNGLLKTASSGEPRFDSDPLTGQPIGLLVEEERINTMSDSPRFVPTTSGGKWTSSAQTLLTPNAGIAPDGTSTASRFEQIAPATNNQSRAGHALDYTLSSNTQHVYSFFAKLETSSTENFVGFAFGTSAYASNPNQIPTFLSARFEFDSNGEPTGTIEGSSVGAGYKKYANGWYKLWIPVYTFTNSLTFNGCNIAVGKEANAPASTYGKFLIWGPQFETTGGSTNPGSFIYTPSGSAATRAADLITFNSPIPDSGSIYVDAKPESVAVNSTLLSLKNVSNQKINLAVEERTELYDSPALVYSIQGSVKPTLPFPVPTTSRERNIITWGTNNYQYGTGSARFAQSLSSSVPANLNQLSVGHDAVDPTKGFNGYINSVYLYRGEITPTVAEALVRGELDPIDADVFVPAGPAGSLSFIINTQGSSVTGDKSFTFPAASDAGNNDIVITWGDQTESGLENAAAEIGAPGLTKDYSLAGIYSIFVEGRLENIQFNSSDSAADLVQIVSWGTAANGNDVFRSPSTMSGAFAGCSNLEFSSSARTLNLPDTSGVTNWTNAFLNCSSITGVFPSFNFSSATSFNQTFKNCSSLVSFTAAGDQTQNVTNFRAAWDGCASLTSFPLINTSSGEDYAFAWRNCTSLAPFPPIITSSGTNFQAAWQNCTSLTQFPPLIFSSATSVNAAWQGCTGLTQFPIINVSSVTDFRNAWTNCTGLLQFPGLTTTAAGELFNSTWQGLTSITQFPQLDLGSGTSFTFAWSGCSSLLAMPPVTIGSATNVSSAWSFCSVLNNFPALDFTNVTGSPLDSGFTGFRDTWRFTPALTNFPANLFDSTTCTQYTGAFQFSALSAQSIENILVSINNANTSDGVLDLDGGTSANKATWSTTANNAYNALTGRNWDISFNTP